MITRYLSIPFLLYKVKALVLPIVIFQGLIIGLYQKTRIVILANNLMLTYAYLFIYSRTT